MVTVWKKLFISVFALSLMGNVILLVNEVDSKHRFLLEEEYAYSVLPSFMHRASRELDLASKGQQVSQHLALAREYIQFVAGTTIQTNTVDNRINSSFLNTSLAASLSLPQVHSGPYSSQEMASIRRADHVATLIATDLDPMKAGNLAAERTEIARLRRDLGMSN